MFALPIKATSAQVGLHSPIPSAKSSRGAIQSKLEIGPVDDPLEREADRIADMVVSGGSPGVIGAASSGVAQRKCAGCEMEEEQPIRRTSDVQSAAVAGPTRAAAAARALAHDGSPLAARERAYFEPRFGRDLSQVRVHTHARAAAAAADIGARAYTLRNDIAFAAGEYSPATPEGRRLIAHELVHVAQQAPHIARQAAPFYTRTFRDDAGGDELEYVEIVQVAPTATAAGIEGSVDRRVFAPASGSLPRQQTHTGRVRHIRLTPAPDCRLVVPLRIAFQQAQSSPRPDICKSPPNATPVTLLPAAQFRSIQTQYVDALNSGLNNRYAARVSGCQTNQPCTDQPIPVVIAAEPVTNNPDITIDVVNRGGRADAATICAGSFTSELPMHEGGHQALGAADEYLETNPQIIARANAAGLHWERPERVRRDLSGMEDEYSYGRFTLFHERHFRFAQVFLEAVMQGQGCTVSLDPVSRSPAEFRLDVGFGGASTSLGGMGYASLFVGAGIPLERRRRLTFLIGAQGQALGDLSYRDQRAFMGGLRVGLEAQTSPARFGVTGSLFATGGGFHQPASTPPSWTGLPSTAARSSVYGEVGGSLGIQSGMFSGGWLFRAGIEGAAGREFSNDPNAMNWWRLGLTIGISR